MSNIVLFVAAMGACVLSAFSLKAVDEPDGMQVRFRVMGSQEYNSFVKEWDNKKEPLLYALIQSQAQWNAVFHPAPVMGGANKKFVPDEATFEKEALLLVARVTAAPGRDSLKSVFQAAGVTAGGDGIVLSYKFEQPHSKQPFKAKSFLGVWIPRQEFKKIKFVENGEQVGILDLSGGQWSVPPITTSAK